MEINEIEFHRALLEYFKNYSITSGGWTADYTKRIVKELDSLIKMELIVVGRESVKVNIGHVFGPFGFKIQKE